ncbi:MAG: aminoglycoside phosphotransferase family protein [Chromatiales bacterium]
MSDAICATPQSAAPDTRREELRAWLEHVTGCEDVTMVPASEDASFRRYFRVRLGATTQIAMDAPPAQEDCGPFLKVATLLREAGVHAPEVIARDEEQGFLLLEDLGTQTYLDVLDKENAGALFADAVDALIRWQLSSRHGVLPPYDEALLRRELALFSDWYVARHLNVALTAPQQATLEAMFSLIVRRVFGQAQVFVHRDYMPRNLMLSDPNPGVIDFQDAVEGPITYDVVCLFKDAFVSWEEELILDWTARYWEKAKGAGLLVPAAFGEFYQEFEWMGLQRHLKVLGIFARINYRDGKPRYLADSPRFMTYVRAVAGRYGLLRPLLRLLDELEGRTLQVGYTF